MSTHRYSPEFKEEAVRQVGERLKPQSIADCRKELQSAAYRSLSCLIIASLTLSVIGQLAAEAK